MMWRELCEGPRVRGMYQFFIFMQCLYITLLYLFNVQYINATLHEHWPKSLGRFFVPDDMAGLHGISPMPPCLTWLHVCI